MGEVVQLRPKAVMCRSCQVAMKFITRASGWRVYYCAKCGRNHAREATS